jgi:hypothetical protein
MVGKVGTHMFHDERGAHVDIVPKLAGYGSPRHGWPTALHFVAWLFHGSPQPRKMPIRFAVAVLFVSLLNVVPLVWAMDAIQEEKGSATAAEYDAMNICCWKTYANERCGFEMKFPPDFAVETGTPLAVIEGAVLRLLLVNRCGSLAEKRDIAGVSFFRDSSWEGAVGHQYGLIGYSALYGGSCYRLALFIHCINIHVFDPGTVSEFDRIAVLKLFDQVISTFQFVKFSSPLLP